MRLDAQRRAIVCTMARTAMTYERDTEQWRTEPYRDRSAWVAMHAGEMIGLQAALHALSPGRYGRHVELAERIVRRYRSRGERAHQRYEPS